jgi:hypothetical protein
MQIIAMDIPSMPLMAVTGQLVGMVSGSFGPGDQGGIRQQDIHIRSKMENYLSTNFFTIRH